MTITATVCLIGASGLINATSYDPLGRFYHATGAAGANLTTFLYDGDELVLEFDVSGIVQKRYVHGPTIR